MDSNLHHWHWNPPNYFHSHPQSTTLICMCASQGFFILSPSHFPTFFSAFKHLTFIDLTCENHISGNYIVNSKNPLNNQWFQSSRNHFFFQIHLTALFPPTHVSHPIKSVNQNILKEKFSTDFTDLLCHNDLSSSYHIDNFARDLSTIIQNSLSKQGRKVNYKPSEVKPWWDKTILKPIIKTRNKACKWLILPRSQSTYHYLEIRIWASSWIIKTKSPESSSCSQRPQTCYDSYFYTKNKPSNTIDPLCNSNNSLTTNKEDQAGIVFQGTLVIYSAIYLWNIHISCLSGNFSFTPSSTSEVENIICILANSKAPGPNKIQNEVIKFLIDELKLIQPPFFNRILFLGNFPIPWQNSITNIIKKSKEDDYSNPNSYRPTALLNTLKKIFETVINNFLAYLIDFPNSVAPGHMGAVKGCNIFDAHFVFGLWVKHKWGKKMIVFGIFLDVKSEYPSVYKECLI